MKLAMCLVVLLLAGCYEHESPNPWAGPLTYEALANYPVSCELDNQQLAHLKKIKQDKNFDPDPDNLSLVDREYNSKLKATIWWYSYSCDKS
jgi:hypothetical protein